MSKRKSTNWYPASKKDVQQDFSFLLEYYNFDVKNAKMSIKLNAISKLGIGLNTNTTTQIGNTPFTRLKDEIIFYSNPSGNKVKELIRHFKNIVSHPENIKKAKIDGVSYYRIEDKYKQNSNLMYTMKGCISVNIWKNFIQQLRIIIDNNISTVKL